MSTLSSRLLLSAALGAATALCSPLSFAGSDGCTTLALGIMRCDALARPEAVGVVAELRNAQERGEMKTVGELGATPESESVPMPAVSLTRAQVKQELALARANHELPRVGELY